MAALGTLALIGVLTPGASVPETVAAVISIACLTVAIQIGVYVAGSYLELRPSHVRSCQSPVARVQLDALMVAAMALIGAGALVAVRLLSSAAPEPAAWVIPSLMLSLAYYWVVLAIMNRAEVLGLSTGHEIAGKWRAWRWTVELARSGRRFAPVGWVLDSFDHKTARGEPSAVVLAIATVLFFAPAIALYVELSAEGRQTVQELLGLVTEPSAGKERPPS